jgi:hypothetical protein
MPPRLTCSNQEGKCKLKNQTGEGKYIKSQSASYYLSFERQTKVMNLKMQVILPRAYPCRYVETSTQSHADPLLQALAKAFVEYNPAVRVQSSQ